MKQPARFYSEQCGLPPAHLFRRPVGPPRITPGPDRDLGQLADQGLTVGYHEIVLFWRNRFGNWAENPSVISVRRPEA
jgi:hypothetical protein